jgi:hypothetical protein
MCYDAIHHEVTRILEIPPQSPKTSFLTRRSAIPDFPTPKFVFVTRQSRNSANDLHLTQPLLLLTTFTNLRQSQDYKDLSTSIQHSRQVNPLK